MTQSPQLISSYVTGSVVESPVGLVLTESKNRSNAMTVSFFSEVAHHPTTLWVSIARDSYTHSLIEESGRFSLIVLHKKQNGIAWNCGSVSGRHRDKCADLDIYPGPEGFLYLKNALSSVACRVRSKLPVGDHTLFVADILAGELETKKSTLRHLLIADMV